MVTMQTADNALKSFYLDAVTEAIDTEYVRKYRRSRACCLIGSSRLIPRMRLGFAARHMGED